MDMYGEDFILKMRHEIEREEIANKKHGVYINGETIPLVRMELKQQVSILVPENFIDLPSSLANIKYPYGQKPEIIKTSLDTKTNLTFNFLNQKLYKENVLSSLCQMKILLQNLNPAFIFSEPKAEDVNGQVIAFTNFKSFAIDNQVYNLLFLTPIGDKTMHAVFNCIYTEKFDWELAFETMMMSVVDINKEKRG